MEKVYFLRTARLGFSQWTRGDSRQAALLWGDPAVTRFLCASGRFSPQQIAERLETEVKNGESRHVQYWPVFLLTSGELVGCCGLRPHDDAFELGVHLRPAFWGQGYAAEAAGAVNRYAFEVIGADRIFAGHHPQNEASRKLLSRLGFVSIGDEFYAPTGLHHPSYELHRGERR